ncbi:macrophage mannose receptor 1-like [Colossoma macropomum]|uniref:macrophage mannose receptor 1-like n=1 Tax=Colossoma macropomum TaxID=42526 RepID=UPI001864F85A|nr:macrophage mannose receptor 1-like [Colossoma macropomum]XP_036420707.1 macrophage mannose receptor 1-like [Colossoma macropomum]
MDQKWISVFFLLSVVCGLSAYVPHRYHFVNESKTWIEARSYCRQIYTDLATINNMEEMNKLTEIIKDKSLRVWIGLERVDWQWLLQDGTVYKARLIYSNWATGEPNNNDKEVCVLMNEDGEWKDEECSYSSPFVCFEGKQSRHVFINDAKSWHDAQSYCRKNDTDLASVRNQTENDEVKKVANRKTVWIGLSRVSWKWSDESYSSFRYWMQKQPDNSGGKENCGEIVMTDEGRWNDAKCEEKFSFICYENQLILINQNLTWREALRYCRDHHVDLVSVHSEEIQLWVKEVAQKASTEHVWLGLRHTCTLSFWFWVSGESICYQNWAPGNGSGEEDCSFVERTGAVQSRGGQQWVSLPEDQKLNFICTTYED